MLMTTSIMMRAIIMVHVHNDDVDDPGDVDILYVLS